MTSNVSNSQPFIGAQIGWSAADSIKGYLNSKISSKDPKVEIAKEGGKRAVDIAIGYVVPHVLGSYFSPLKYLGLSTQLAFSVVSNSSNAVAHTGIAAKKYFDGNKTEATNHIQSAAMFVYRAAIDYGIYAAVSAVGVPAIIAKTLVDVVAPNFLREKTTDALNYVDGKIGGLKGEAVVVAGAIGIVRVAVSGARRGARRGVSGASRRVSGVSRLVVGELPPREILPRACKE